MRKALESVMSQTYKDWECIIVNDGSTDESLRVVEDYIRETMSDERLAIRVISQKNAGVAAARNRGVKESRGEYVCFLDADDWWEPNFIDEIDRLIIDYPDAGIYCTNYIYYKPGKTHVALKLPRGYMDYPKAYLQGPMPIWTGATCMPRNVFDEMGEFPVGIQLGEDFLLWAKTATHYKVAFCEKPLAYYNNDVPSSLRATRNLHAPEYHMLFHLDPLEKEVANSLTPSLSNSWMLLFDKLRIVGLMPYWLSDEYHTVAAEELTKVDWSMQPKSVIRLYKTPIWILKLKRCIMRLGSWGKQKLLTIVNRR